MSVVMSRGSGYGRRASPVMARHGPLRTFEAPCRGEVPVFAKRAAGLLLALLLLAPLVHPAPARATELLFYSSVPGNLTDALTHDFEAHNPGITVETFQAGTETLLQKMELEIKGGGHPTADVMWVQERAAMERFAATGLLAGYMPPGTDAIGTEYKDGGGHWFANFVSFVVLMYNKPAFAGQTLPTSWKDLAAPEFKDKIMFADPQVSGTGATVAASFVQDLGWPFIEAVAANEPRLASGHPAMVSTVISGERVLCPMQDVSLAAALAHHEPVGFVFPAEGAIAVPAYAAMSATSSHMAAAKKFMDYMASLDAANLLRKHGMYDTRTDAEPPAGWPRIGTIKTMPFDAVRYKRDKEQIISRFSDLTER